MQKIFTLSKTSFRLSLFKLLDNETLFIYFHLGFGYGYMDTTFYKSLFFRFDIFRRFIPQKDTIHGFEIPIKSQQFAT